MAVIVIIGLLAAATTVAVMGSIGKARTETTRASIKSIMNAANRFKMDTSQYPKKLQHMVEKPGYVSEEEWAGPYLKSVPRDGWGNEFQFRGRGSKIVVKSLGADGQPGGKDDNADISNITMRENDDN
jgi:general secretion pathway protein G